MDVARHQLVGALGRRPVGPVVGQQQRRAEAAVRSRPQPLEMADAVVRRADAGDAFPGQVFRRVGDAGRQDGEGRHVGEILGIAVDAELHLLERLFARRRHVGEGDDAPLGAIRHLAVLAGVFAVGLPVRGMRLERVVRGAADGQHADAVAAGRHRAHRRARAGHGHFHAGLAVGRKLELGGRQVEPVGLLRHRLAGHQLDDHVQRFVHARALVGRLDADLGRVVHQRAGADAEHGAAARHVVELGHARGQHEGVVVGQRDHARAEADMPGALGRGGDEHLRRGDDLEAAGVMLADPGLVIVQPVEMLDQLHVALDGERGILVERVERRQKDARAQEAVGQGRFPRSCGGRV